MKETRYFEEAGSGKRSSARGDGGDGEGFI